MRRYLPWPLLLPLLGSAPPVPAANPVWLIGGGPDLFNSQVQIERNVLWTQETLARFPGQRQIRTYFTDGEDPAPDVTQWAPLEGAENLEPLARVFDVRWQNGEQYRPHRIPGVAGSIAPEVLKEALSTQLRALGNGDQAWLIFNGHGSRAETGEGQIALWADGQLGMRQLRALLDQAPAGARVRFLFTQCYAGAFAGLAVPNRNRCGFLAEAADRPAEGCSAAIAQGDYQDYSTYFLAALGGQTREGRPLAADPDLDGDGQVSPLEAHFFTLAQSYSTDIPRATSEVLLERWQPWYLPALLALTQDAPTPYRTLVRTLTQAAGLDPDDERLDAALSRKNKELAAARGRLEQERERQSQETEDLRVNLERELLGRWPGARHPYTRAFARFLSEDLDAAQGFLLAHANYPLLKAGQTTLDELDDRLLDLERAATRLEKIRHLRQLGQRQAALERFGPVTLRRRFEALRACEAAPF